MPPTSPTDEEMPDIDFLLEVSARMADTHDNADDFLAWARSSLPHIAPQIFQNDIGPESERMAYWMARGIWNAIPLASNGFKPRPLPSPQRNQPCPCGSLKKFKHCCRNLPEPPVIPTLAIWPWVILVQTDSYWLDQAKSDALPLIGIVHAANQFHENGSWRSLRKLIEPLFATDRLIKDARCAVLVDPLCDAYDALLRTDRNKLQLLERLATHTLAPIRAAANQRLASFLHDQGDTEKAWHALQMAIRADPGDPANALLEMTILASEGNVQQAQQRAVFWLHQFRQDTSVPVEALDLLEAIRENPRRGFRELSRQAVPPLINELLSWLDQQSDRALPELKWRSISAPADDSLMQDAFEPLGDGSGIEIEWQQVSGAVKPFSVQWTSGEEAEIWSEAEHWLPWLTNHPNAFDCLSILDDLASLLYAVDIYLLDNSWLSLLTERGAAMLEKNWPASRPGTLPWIIAENRPALRLLAHSISMHEEDWSDERLQQRLQLYLRLNPNDNHGFRSLLVNLLLCNGEDAMALKIIDQYPDDGMPELSYGRALALYRLKRGGEAITALQSAVSQLPLVLDYLVNDKAKQPRMDPMGIRHGGKDQAWLYREAMRITWLSTGGMQDWLASLKQKLG